MSERRDVARKATIALFFDVDNVFLNVGTVIDLELTI